MCKLKFRFMNIIKSAQDQFKTTKIIYYILNKIYIIKVPTKIKYVLT